MTYSNFAPHFSSNPLIIYNLIDLCLSYPQEVNYIFTLGSIINSGSLVLFSENSYLAFNIP